MTAPGAGKGAIVVVDYGMGNLRSVWQALAHVAAGRQVLVTSDPAEVAAAERVVVPGQGAMPDCMREIEAAACVQRCWKPPATSPSSASVSVSKCSSSIATRAMSPAWA
jgi:hypothetical protein